MQHEAPLAPIKKRLPLPKNVVLLSLIEATELASQNVRNKNSPRGELRTTWDKGCSDGDGDEFIVNNIRSMGSMIDVDDEEEKIKMGTSLAVGVDGTYAVAAREGLEIYANRPDAMDKSAATLADEDVENLVRFFHDDKKPDRDPTARLSYGDRVQIVSLDEGWAKLARGYGYISAERQHLVKGRCTLFRGSYRGCLQGEETKLMRLFSLMASQWAMP
jgi:hypothetical protein